MAVQFLSSQVGLFDQNPVPWTGDPFKLLWSDTLLLLQKWRTLPGIIRPLHLGKNASSFDELYPSWWNIVAICLHCVLFFTQSFFLMSLPFCLTIPSGWVLIYFAIYYIWNCAISRILNGKGIRLEPSQHIMYKDKHDDEYWIYLNGVSVGKTWLQSNIDRLSLTFGRPVHGVHNPTDGIIFDVIQCLIQRNFCYSTEDIRAAYVSIKDALLKKDIKKVVFILHSQGGIEGGLIIDWLLAEMPEDYLRKLEVYAFASAANHFSNPVRSRGTPDQPGFNHRHHKTAIRHIEHYANAGDFVSQYGVINYTGVQNRFMGRLFISPKTGHLLNQHYLQQMFPLGEDKRCLDKNDFMETDFNVNLENLTEEGREELITSLAQSASKEVQNRIAYVGDINSPISPVCRTLSLLGDDNRPARVLKIKDFSRLWQYRNGGGPDDDS